MNHGANASRTHHDRRRRRVLAGALLGLEDAATKYGFTTLSAELAATERAKID